MNASGNVYAMHDKTCLPTDIRVRKTIPYYPQCIGYHGSFADITMVPNACNKEGDADLSASRDKDNETNAMHE